MKVAFLDIKSQIASYIQIRTLHPGKQIANSKTAQILSLVTEKLVKWSCYTNPQKKQKGGRFFAQCVILIIFLSLKSLSGNSEPLELSKWQFLDLFHLHFYVKSISRKTWVVENYWADTLCFPRKHFWKPLRSTFLITFLVTLPFSLFFFLFFFWKKVCKNFLEGSHAV